MDKYVSVCIPAHNRAGSIGRMLESIIHQTYNKLHIYVCDNASTDNTREVVESFQDSRIKYIYYDEYLDVNYSFIRTLKCAEDEIVCLFHSDDRYHSDIIERYLKFINDETVGAVFCKMRRINENEEAKEYRYYDNEISTITYDYEQYLNQALCEGTIFNCPTFMTKKSVLYDSGILESTRLMISDMSFWLPIVRKYKCVVLDVPLMDYVISETQLSRKIKRASIRTVSPQFILLDAEIKRAKKVSVNIKEECLEKYKTRRREELLSVKDSQKNILKKWWYTILLKFNFDITIKKIACSEKHYFDILYGRIHK